MNVLSTGVSVAVIGMGIVFLVLIILWGVLEAMRLIFSPKENKKKEIEPAAIKELPSQKTQDTEDEEIVCVISAAVAAMLQQPSHTFKIKSIKRSPDNSPEWNKAGRQRLLGNIL